MAFGQYFKLAVESKPARALLLYVHYIAPDVLDKENDQEGAASHA